jgi:hypothetical protein
MCSDFSQDVRRIRDGNSFATRSVAAKQEGQWTLGRHCEDVTTGRCHRKIADSP